MPNRTDPIATVPPLNKKISFKKMQAAANQKQQHPKNSSAMITKLNQNWKSITRSIEEKKACSFIWSKNGSVCQVERTNHLLRMKKTWRKNECTQVKKSLPMNLPILNLFNKTKSCWSDSAIANLFFAITVLKHTVEQTHIFFYI